MIYQSPNRRCVSGFTLLEIIVVMVIIGMAAALIIPRITSGQANILKAQVREAMAVLKYARRIAIVEGKQKVATFYEGKQEAGDNSTKTAMPGRWVSRGVTLQWGGEVSDSEEGVYEITFYPEGGSSGGELILTYLDYKAKISVNPITGKVKSDIFDDEQEK
jgi:general secretion pathway protein H